MSIDDRLNEDMKAALKSGDKVRLNTIRWLRARLKDAQIELGRELTDEDAISVLSNAAKKHRESIEMYKQGGRDDLVAQESAELAIIQEYLPEQLSQEDLEKIITEVIQQVNATSLKDMGKVMGKVMQQVRGRADGKQVQRIVRNRLQ